MFMYTIYYIFFFIIVISFVTGLILNIIENKHNKKNDVKALEKTRTIIRENVVKSSVEEELSETISFSTPIIISSVEVSDDIEVLDNKERNSLKKGLTSSIDDSLI